MAVKVLIASGGTGGHLFPAVRLAEEINFRNIGEVLFIISSRRQDRDILRDKDLAFKVLSAIGLQSSNIFHVLDFAVRFIISTIKSLLLILHFRPSVVVGFGGYVSAPVLLVAFLLRIKTIVHEQNVYPGRTNRVLANFVDKIAVSFPETIKYMKRFQSKIILSGNPLRRGLKRTQKTGDKFTVLVVGGSQGSHALNRLIPEAVALMHDDKKNVLDIIHLSGYKDREKLTGLFRDKGIKSRVFSFTNEIHKLYNECDFVIARSGATTVSELLYLLKPAILIPYPHANGHQKLNAEVLKNMGISILLEERNLTAIDLRDAILRLMDREVLRGMAETVKNTHANDACDILLKEILTG